MKKLSLLLVVFSLGLFTLGCTEDTSAPSSSSTPSAPSTEMEDDTSDTTDIDVSAPDAGAPSVEGDAAPAGDAAAPVEGDAAAPEGQQ